MKRYGNKAGLWIIVAYFTRSARFTQMVFDSHERNKLYTVQIRLRGGNRTYAGTALEVGLSQ